MSSIIYKSTHRPILLEAGSHQDYPDCLLRNNVFFSFHPNDNLDNLDNLEKNEYVLLNLDNLDNLEKKMYMCY